MVASLEIDNVARVITVYVIIPKIKRLVATAASFFWLQISQIFTKE